MTKQAVLFGRTCSFVENSGFTLLANKCLTAELREENSPIFLDRYEVIRLVLGVMFPFLMLIVNFL